MKTEPCPCCGQAMKPKKPGLPVVSLDTNTVSTGGRSIKVTPQQAEILTILAARSPAPVPHETLYSRLWGATPHMPDGPDKIVQVNVCKLRKKLAGAPLAIETIYDTGYRLVTKETAPCAQ